MDRNLEKKLLKKRFLPSKNGKKISQTAGYDGARMCRLGIKKSLVRYIVYEIDNF
jgi:hypothetical protein